MKRIQYNSKAVKRIFNEEKGENEYIELPLIVECEWSETAETALKDKIINVYEDGAADTNEERLSRVEAALAAFKDFYERFSGGKLNV